MIHHTRKKIAIIGSGISGLSAAYILSPHHEVTVYEKETYIGGHSRTLDVPSQGGASATCPVDTGFIVFNHKNYPLLTSLFKHLDVPTVKSDMSFGVSIDDGWLEYGTQELHHIFAQKRNLLRPQFLKMLRDILKFNKYAHRYIDSDPSMTLGDCLDQLGMGNWFKEYYLLAMGGAIWSTPLKEILAFPVRTFIRFFDNHGLLSVNDQPQWYTVQGGSREYVTRLTRVFQDNIKLSCAAVSVTKTADQKIKVLDSNEGETLFDEVVFACHSDQALALIEQPSPAQKSILGAIRYQANKVVLHSDTSFMPQRKKAWASWVYLSEQAESTDAKMCLSYWMNNLQPLDTQHPIIVTLNPPRPPKSELTYNTHWFDHPVFDCAALSAQERIPHIQGQDHMWFCGAYQRYGFHEDGILSAVTMAQKMGHQPQWT